MWARPVLVVGLSCARRWLAAPGLCSLAASTPIAPSVTTPMSPDVAECLLGAQWPEGENCWELSVAGDGGISCAMGSGWREGTPRLRGPGLPRSADSRGLDADTDSSTWKRCPGRLSPSVVAFDPSPQTSSTILVRLGGTMRVTTAEVMALHSLLGQKVSAGSEVQWRCWHSRGLSVGPS